MITNNNACPSPVRNALLSSLMLLGLVGSGLCCAKAQPGHRMDELAHKLAREHAGESTPKVYYRPFCRRSHYVTNPSAPCWN
jgi:hypothetical protein